MASQAIRLVIATFVVAFSVGCGNGDGDPPIIIPAEDTGHAEPDAEVTPDAGPGEEDAFVEPDVPAPPADSDGDGVLDEDDNCVDVPNPDQADRDRDGIGDACDHMPYYHDPANPAAVQGLREDETVLSNDTALAGLEYGLSLPFVARGLVDPIDDFGADLDFYSFEIDEPTAVLVHLQSSQTMWGGVIVLGMDFANQNVFRALISSNLGTEAHRDLFLPFAGRYTLVVSDARNLIESQADVGGAGLQYAVSLSALPLPEPEVVTLPMTPSTFQSTGELRVVEVAATDVEGVRATITGAAADANSFVTPLAVLYDPDQKRTVAVNAPGQSAETQVGTLPALLHPRDRLWVIDDHSQQFGTSTTTLNVQKIDLTSEPETASAPADTRNDDLPWLEIGTTIQGRIDAPRGAVGDLDFFLVAVERGQTLKVTVTPEPDGLLEPWLQLTHYGDQTGYPYAFHETDLSTTVAAVSAQYVITATMDGEVAISLEHAGNAFSSTPVGGDEYRYTLSVEDVTPQPATFPTAQFTADVEFEIGGHGLVEFSGTPGEFVSLTVESTLYPEVRVIDTSDWRVIATASYGTTFALPSAGPFWVELVDIIGRGTGGVPSTITVAPMVATPIGALPAVATGVLETTPQALHTFEVTAGDRIDVRVHAPSFFASLDVFDENLQPVGGRFYVDRRFIAPSTGTYTVAVASSSSGFGPGYDYTLGVAKISPAAQQLPATVTASLDQPAIAHWYSVPVTDGALYSATLNAADSGFIDRIRFFSEDLLILPTSTSGSLRWLATYTGLLWIVVEDTGNAGDVSFDYTLSVQQTTAIPLPANAPQSAVLADGAATNLHALQFSTSGAVDVVVTPVGDWRPTVLLTHGVSHTALAEATSHLGRVGYAVSEPTELGVVVGAADPTLSGPLSYTIALTVVDATTSIAEVEPNSTAAEAMAVTLPAAIAGGITGADVDRFQVPLMRGQRVWAHAADRNGFGTNRYSARVRLFNEADVQVADNYYSGEGYMPALHGVQVAASGAYQVAYLATSAGAADGDYTLYIIPGPSAEVLESEPNDTIAQAQSLGRFVGPTRVQLQLDVGDALDLFEVEVGEGASLAAALENAPAGLSLRLLDSAGAEVVATAAELAATALGAGTYFVELSSGSEAGDADLIVTIE